MTEVITRADVMSGIEYDPKTVPDGYSSYTGAPYEYNPVQLPPPPPVAPVITRLSPASVPVDSPDTTLYAIGIDFDSTAILVFNGSDELSTYWPEGMVSTGLQPSTASGPHTVPVQVRNTDGQVSNTVEFRFTPAEPASGLTAEDNDGPEDEPAPLDPSDPESAKPRPSADAQPAD